MVLNQLQQEVLKGQFHGKSPDEQIRIAEMAVKMWTTDGSVYEVQPQGDLLADLEFIRPILVCNAIPGSIWHQQAKLVREEDFVSGLARSMIAFCCPSAVVIG